MTSASLFILQWIVFQHFNDLNRLQLTSEIIIETRAVLFFWPTTSRILLSWKVKEQVFCAWLTWKKWKKSIFTTFTPNAFCGWIANLTFLGTNWAEWTKSRLLEWSRLHGLWWGRFHLVPGSAFEHAFWNSKPYFSANRAYARVLPVCIVQESEFQYKPNRRPWIWGTAGLEKGCERSLTHRTRNGCNVWKRGGCFQNNDRGHICGIGTRHSTSFAPENGNRRHHQQRCVWTARNWYRVWRRTPAGFPECCFSTASCRCLKGYWFSWFPLPAAPVPGFWSPTQPCARAPSPPVRDWPYSEVECFPPSVQWCCAGNDPDPPSKFVFGLPTQKSGTTSRERN